MSCRAYVLRLDLIALGLAFVTLARDADAVALTPGSYAISMKYLRGNQVVVRLAMYSFRSDQSFRADYWEWDSGPLWDSGALMRTIGTAGPPSTDAAYSVVGSMHFRGATGNGNENLTTRFGTWSTYKSTNIKIIWGDTGKIEWWKQSWHDTTLNKIELFYIDDVSGSPRDTHLSLDQTMGVFSRDFGALNAGFGFGGDTVGFTFGYQTVAPFRKGMAGQFLRWNRYCIETPSSCPMQSGPNSYGVWSYHFGSAFQVTSTDVLRRFDSPGTVPGYDLFSYLGIPPGNTSMTSRRVSMQISHDWDADGYVQDSFGHMYNGLQIIDDVYNLRGAVFADATFEPPWLRNGMYIMSAMFLLDDTSEAAQTGIESPTNW